ncbi:MAG: FKBP-type peptidyl-prolyl cis-trans isomerase [Paludibacter sp.]|nr:FKBP-type peptidyl-prolyl cis-trans isomerase [Paludibacter sp.]MDD4198756.1 FKBP-type peptidyl-prolyl cis-trans isomerase [Paludibacter sp.]MDD4426918.1 FKBP-type peptidyl-prolyl cis-trans isomerase [Paludibacter sp.]
MKITDNKFVATEYELFVDGENEGEMELMERATSEQPMKFVYGVGMMLQKFEENLFGLEEGDKFEFTIPVDEAYGPYLDENILDLDRSIFEIEGKLDERIIFAGNIVPLMDSEGNHLNAQVVEITNTHVKVDLNHPLAGENLHFKGSILEVRKSSEKELVELLGGNGGCGCGDDCGCGSDEEAGGCGCGSGCGCH